MTRLSRRNPPKNVQPQTPGEALFLQQALAYYRESQAVGDNAPYGQVLNHMDQFAFQHGRDLARKGLELAMQERIENEEKKTKLDNVKNVTKKHVTTDTDTKTS
jgi:hypothetical protein